MFSYGVLEAVERCLHPHADPVHAEMARRAVFSAGRRRTGHHSQGAAPLPENELLITSTRTNGCSVRTH
jgi:hypothetical protein